MNNYYLSPAVSDSSMGTILYKMAENEAKARPLIILCIGSDRCTGDSLGPIIGYKLSRYEDSPVFKRLNTHIYGTLKAPVHALNLNTTIDKIYENHQNPYVIAIDASLGKSEKIGQVTIGKGPLTPGLGVNKTLPSVGDLHITGIVNSRHTSSAMLQTTRLCHIMDMADYIVGGILTMLLRSVEVD